jgi:hypothetical protein
MSEINVERELIVSSMMKIDSELAGLKRNSPQRQQLVRQKIRLVQELRDLRIKSYPYGDPKEIITDHAVLRWLERKHGINVAVIRETILTPMLRKAVENQKPYKTYYSDGDVVFVIDRGAIQTVVEIGCESEEEEVA